MCVFARVRAFRVCLRVNGNRGEFFLFQGDAAHRTYGASLGSATDATFVVRGTPTARPMHRINSVLNTYTLAPLRNSLIVRFEPQNFTLGTVSPGDQEHAGPGRVQCRGALQGAFVLFRGASHTRRRLKTWAYYGMMR